MWTKSKYGRGRFLAGRSAILVPDEWVVKIDPVSQESKSVGQHPIIGGWVIPGSDAHFRFPISCIVPANWRSQTLTLFKQ